MVLERTIFYLSVFLLIGYHLFLEKGIYLNQLEIDSLHPRMLCASLVDINPETITYLEKKLLNVVNLFLVFRNNLRLGPDVALRLKKLESPSPRDALRQIDPAVLEKKMKM